MARGVFIGFGTAVTLYPLVLLLVLLLLCWRAGTVREFTRTALGAVGAWVAVNLPIVIFYPSGWLEYFRYNSDRGRPRLGLSHPVRFGLVSRGTMTCSMRCRCWERWYSRSLWPSSSLRAPTRPASPSWSFLAVAGFLLINKAWSPQQHSCGWYRWRCWPFRTAVAVRLDGHRRAGVDSAYDAVSRPRASLASRRMVHRRGGGPVSDGRRPVRRGRVQIWHPEDDLVRTGAGSVASGPNGMRRREQ